MHKDTGKVRIAALASGTGTNVENLIHSFAGHPRIELALVVSDNTDALVLNKAANAGLPHLVIRKSQWQDAELVLGIFNESQIDLVVLAGFLLLLPAFFIDYYRGRILNIHPALLPAHGGKGMYGDRVHKAVIESGDRISGISIHQVNERYDEGPVVFQAIVEVAKGETPASLAAKIHALEYAHYPRVIEEYVAAHEFFTEC